MDSVKKEQYRNSDIFKAIERNAPRYLAEKWDNVGLQVGSYSHPVCRVLLTLDVTPDVVEEAIEKDIDLIVSHHPFLFNGVKSICVDDGKGQLIDALIAHKISVYSAHTNLDAAEYGLNYFIAKALGLEEMRPLSNSPKDRLYKLVVFVPESHTEAILQVMGDNDAGYVGKYSHCSFRAVGKGTFKPLSESKPFIGSENQVETVAEDRIETVIDNEMAKSLIQKIKAVHPYETMAYDLYPMDESLTKEANGPGKIGDLSTALLPQDFLEKLKSALGLKLVRTAGKPPQVIKRIALCTGAGAEFMGLAKVRNADVYVTGDLKYHEAQSAHENHLWVVDAGHYGTEHQVVLLLKEMIAANCPGVETIISEKMCDFLEIH